MDARSTRRRFLASAAAWQVALPWAAESRRLVRALAAAGGATPSSSRDTQAWTPHVFGVNLIHWWDAADAANQTIDRASGRLVSWRDRVGGIVVSQPTEALRPLVRKREVEIRFAGRGISLMLPNLSLAYIEHTWFLMLFRVRWSMVGSADGSFFAVNGYDGGDGTRQPFCGYVRRGSIVTSMWANSGSPNAVGVSAAGNNIWHSVVSRRLAGGPNHLSVDGGPEQIGGANTALPLSQSSGVIGDFRSTYLDWALDTLIIGQGELAPADVTKLHAWAMWRRGSERRLPRAAPYRRRRPIARRADLVVESPDGEGTPGFDWSSSVWDERHQRKPLDLTGYKLTFEDDFDDLSTVTDGVVGAGPWYAPARPDTTSAHFNSPLQTPNPFSIETPSVLTITMQNVGGRWFSGHMQTVNTAGRGFAQKYGYFEAKMAFEKAIGWPAFWLYARKRYKDTAATLCEIDVVEAYGDNDYKGNHMTVWRHAAYRPQPGHLHKSVDKGNYVGMTTKVFGTDDLFDGSFHRYGCEIDEKLIIIYFDGLEVARFPTYPEANLPLYMLVSLQMQPGFEARATTTHLYVDWVRAYAKASNL